MVVTANFRGTMVVVKRALPSRAKSGRTSTGHADMLPADIFDFKDNADYLADAVFRRSVSLTELKRKRTLTTSMSFGSHTSTIRSECSSETGTPKLSPLKVTCPVQCSHLLSAGSACNGTGEIESSPAPKLKSFHVFSAGIAGLVYACDPNGRHRSRRIRYVLFQNFQPF